VHSRSPATTTVFLNTITNASMDVASGPPDDEPPKPNANMSNGDDVVSLESQQESCLSESFDEGNSDTDDWSSAGTDFENKFRKSSAEVKRLNKTSAQRSV
jgi:hypothetical protein